MRQLTILEVKDNQEKLDLTSTFLYNMEKGRIALYRYETNEERTALLQKDWCYDSEHDKFIALRINKAVLTSESSDLAKEALEELKRSTHMKLYKKSEKFLPHESIKCGDNYEKETGKRIRYIGIEALLGSYLRVKIDGRFYRFNEHDHSLVGRW
ncbi:hypothetical protein CN918_31620 [Priestia megaterium]|nr:hypothetical protein CN918_31620 [Priestia megaterium]